MESPKRTYTKHPFSERCRVVSFYKQGLGSKRIARLTGLDASLVRKWLRRYRAGGLETLRDGRLVPSTVEFPLRRSARSRKEELFKVALEAYATTLEPVTSIARRHGLDYRKFRYHIVRHHPELTARRNGLKCIGNNL